jgi:hypothetical protein
MTSTPSEAPSLPGEQGAAGGGESVAMDATMFGDLLVPAPSIQSSVTPGVLMQLAQAGQTTTPATHPIGSGGGFAAATVPFHSAINISENEIPRPMDRAYVMYNYYSDVAASGLAFGSTGAQVHREMVGGEKTFLSGNASVGVRLPVFEIFGTSSEASSQLGNTSLIFKYAFLNNRRTGDVFSAGMVLSLPTGVALKVPGQSSVNSTYFQPWAGGIFHIGNVYFIDFTSIAAPTDARDVTLFFESFGVGYWAYRNPDRNAWFRGIIPTVEFHANIPLNHQGLSSVPIGFPNMVDFTGGCYFLIRRAFLGMAAGTPLTGPRPYGVEGMVSLNYFF